MKQIKFILAVLMAVVFQNGHGMESWYGNALSLAFRGNAVQAVQTVYNNDKEAIKVTDSQLVPEEIKDVITSKFVAVGYSNEKGGIISYSIDGINWKETTGLSADYELTSVCYGKDKFVVVGRNNAVGGMAAYSTDGINWNKGSLPSDFWNLESVCYGNGKFVAVGESDKTVYSTDGINWKEGSLPSDFENAGSVCYGNGKFVAVCNIVPSGRMAAYSTNGTSWTAHDIDERLGSVYYVNNKFVATSEYMDEDKNRRIKVAHSTNGID